MPNGETGEEMVLSFEQNRSRRMLVVAPLFDEANKLRHQLYEIMRNLDAYGIDCFLPDLPGCNESLANHHEQTLFHWKRCVAAAAAEFSATQIFAVRSGCWLVPGDGRGWLYAPAKPQQILRGMVRARTLASREAGGNETAESIVSLARTSGTELAGWPFGPELIAELEAGDFAPGSGYAIIEQSNVGGKPLWLRAENDSDPEQATRLAEILSDPEGPA